MLLIRASCSLVGRVRKLSVEALEGKVSDGVDTGPVTIDLPLLSSIMDDHCLLGFRCWYY